MNAAKKILAEADSDDGKVKLSMKNLNGPGKNFQFSI